MGLVRGNIDQSTHTVTTIGSQTHISGPVSVEISQASQPSPGQLVERGIAALRQGVYENAMQSLARAIELGERDGDVHFYLALAETKGQRPRLLPLSSVRKMEKLLETATRIDPTCFHAFALWALIRQDYYVLNGLSCPAPSAEQLFKLAQPVDSRYVRDIVSSIQAPKNKVWEWLAARTG